MDLFLILRSYHGLGPAGPEADYSLEVPEGPKRDLFRDRSFPGPEAGLFLEGLGD